MSTLLRLAFTISALGIFVCAQAQTEEKTEGHHDFHGCHFTKNKIKMQPLTDAQRSMMCGSNFRSDSIDVLNYAIELDLTGFNEAVIAASCEVTFTAKQEGIDFLPLDLLALSVDSVTHNGDQLTFDYDDLLLNVHLPQAVNTGDIMEVVVHYHGHPTADPGGFGGFVFQNGYAYNLGIGLNSNPYNFGRSWHPCFDNFVERATYDISIVTNANRKGYAVGEFLAETDLGGGEILRQYRMNLPLPTYLVGVAASDYVEVHDMHSGQYGDYPILLLGKPADEGELGTAFVNLPQAIDAFEAWFGPYRWGQVGYVMTTVGAMEHASLIAYPDFSINGGQSFGNDRLMAHELGHHWWGNITTLECPDDMWIKEGNAEYSAHLFTEYAFGKEAFLKQVKDNHYYVLSQAHKDDDGFFPLSGIPFEKTYSNHTYEKGAAMMHNLRSYLGDTLFQQGMTSILETFEFEAMNAGQMQAHLTEVTGVEMSHFFNAWLYQPGFASYVIEAVEAAPSGNEWEVQLSIRQGLRAANNFHTNVPLEVTFFDENWDTYTTQVMVSGPMTDVTATVPFEPVFQLLNDRQFLNMGRMQDRTNVTETGIHTISQVDLINNFEVWELPGDSALVSVVHHWIGPSVQPDIDISTTHYWTYGGIIPPGTKAMTTLQYRGSSEFDLDYELLQAGTDNVVLAWRPNADGEWGEYPWYKKTAFGNNGFMRIDTMLPGDYAFAQGPLPIATSVADVAEVDMLLKIYPNPTAHSLNVQGLLPAETTAEIRISDAMGHTVSTSVMNTFGREFSENLDVHHLPDGMYWLEVRSEDGGMRRVEKWVKK